MPGFRPREAPEAYGGGHGAVEKGMERLPRLAAATFVLAGGLVHLELWRSGYRGIRYIGPLFVANVAISAVVAVAVLVVRDRRVAVAGVALAAGSLAALVASRTVGLLGFTERAWTDDAVRALTAEVGAIVALAAAFVAGRRRPDASLRLVPARVRGWRAGR